MAAGVIRGTLDGAAASFSLAGGTIGVVNARRLVAAALAVAGVHAALLAFRPDMLASNSATTSVSPVMAVRVVRSPPAAPGVPAAPAAAPAEPPAPPRALAERARRAPVDRAPSDHGLPRAVSSSTRAATPPSSMLTAHEPQPAAGVDDRAVAAAPLAAAPDYAFAARLDPGPRPLGDIEPEYPDMAHLREGVVVLRLLISERGVVDNVGVVRAEPRGVFEQAAMEAFGKAMFSPGLAGGMPVKSQITVEVQFMPINRGARVSGRTY